MRNLALFAVFYAAFAAPVIAQTSALAAEAASVAASPLTGNLGLFSSDRLRSIAVVSGSRSL